MDATSFNVDISYSQLAVFKCNMENPFNDWNDIHVSQGFTWRPGSVSFGTLSDAVKCKVDVSISDSLELSNDAIRIISVPFEVGKEGVEVGSITDTKIVTIPEGIYELVFNAIPSNDSDFETYRLVFVKSSLPKAKIILADEELSPPEELLMEAKPA